MPLDAANASTSPSHEGLGAEWAEMRNFCWDLVHKWAKAYNCPALLVKDIYQETVISLIKNGQLLELNRQKGTLRPYLKTILKSKVLNAYRRGLPKNDQPPPEDGENYITKTSTLHLFQDLAQPTEAVLDKIWYMSLFKQALRITFKKLDQVVVKSFLLHVVAGQEAEKVAKTLNIPVLRNVAVYKLRFLDELKAEFFAALAYTMEFDCRHESNLKKNMIFDRLQEELTRSKDQFKESEIFNCPPASLMNQLDFISHALKKVKQPEAEGAYLCHINCEEGEGQDGTDTQTSALKKIELAKLEKLDKRAIVSDFGITEYQWIKIEKATRIGRREENELVLPSGCVSAHHATLTPMAEGWLLKDEQSKNGTFVNGKQIHAEMLKDGDIVNVTSNYQFIFFVKKDE